MALISNVLRLYYLNYYLINEVILFYLKQLFCIYIPSTHILVWVLQKKYQKYIPNKFNNLTV